MKIIFPILVKVHIGILGIGKDAFYGKMDGTCAGTAGLFADFRFADSDNWYSVVFEHADSKFDIRLVI